MQTQEKFRQLNVRNAVIEKFSVSKNYLAIQDALAKLSASPFKNGLLRSIDNFTEWNNRLRSSVPGMSVPFAQYKALTDFSKPIDILEKLQTAAKPRFVTDFVDVKNHLGSISAASLFASNHLEKMSAITNLLQQPYTSILSESFPFSRYMQSYLIPDDSDVAFEDKIEEHSGVIVRVGSNNIQAIINDFYQNEDLLKTISPRKFEEVIAELFRFHRYKVLLTQQTRDGGFDMSMEKVLDDGTPFRALVECKRYNSKVGVETIRCFSAVAYRQKVRHGILVTSSYFTKDVENECMTRPEKTLHG